MQSSTPPSSFDRTTKNGVRSTGKHFFYTLALGSLLVACSGEDATTTTAGSESGTDVPVEQEAPQPVLTTLEMSDSDVTWERFLDQANTKKQVKLFGKMVDVELGNLQLNMEGDVTLTKGSLVLKDDVPKSAEFEIDMNTFHFAEEKGKGLFDVVNHPHSTLSIRDIAATEAQGWMGYFDLTIEGETKTYTEYMQINSMDSESADTVSFSTQLKINTLDFPLRKDPDKAAIKKDEITVKIKASFPRN